MHHFFEKSVACNEAHKNQRIQGKNKKLSKSRRVMHFWVYISKPQKVVTLKYGEKAPTLGTFKVRHRGVKKYYLQKLSVSYKFFSNALLRVKYTVSLELFS